MTPTNNDELAEFQRDISALISKYKPTIQRRTGWYGEHEGLEICLGEKIAANYDEWGVWFIGDKTIDTQKL